MPVSRRDTRATITEWRRLTRGAAAGELPTGRRVLVVASCTAQPLVPSLVVGHFESTATVATIDLVDDNQLFQVCLDPVGHGAAAADEVVLVWRIEDVFERDFHVWGNGGEPDALIAAARSLGAAVARLAREIPGSVVVSDAPTPIGFGLDHHDPELLTGLVELQGALNRAFDDGLGDAPVSRLRLAALQHGAGTRSTFDRRSWLMYRQPFTEAFALDVGAAIADVIDRRTATPPKVVVLDCDDTLWTGVLVDDGIGGLQCGDAFPGFAYRSFQIAMQRLRHQGVLLALASKNDDENIRRAFAEVDGMVLTDDDIAARRVSWEPKPPAVAGIADELDLGLDAFVFVDDSDHEIGAMRTQLPAVRSVQVPADIERLPDLLAETGWFRAMRVTDDDRERPARSC